MAAILSPSGLCSAFLAFTIFLWMKRSFWTYLFRDSNPPLEPIKESLNPAPRVTVIVPAKNEEKNIAGCLRRLADQTYSNYEILVINDRSTDSTSALVQEAARQSKVPIREIPITSLPEGWTGKNHAMFNGHTFADGEWLLFTDADTTHCPYSIATALDTAVKRNIDFLTLAPETECRSVWEKIVQPLAVGSLALWFNATRVNEPNARFTLANGQFILVKKSVYQNVGGNESVRQEVIEDVELAKRVKAAGFTVRFLNGTRLYSTRMYHSLAEIRTGWTRIYTYLFDKKPLPLIKKILTLFFFSLVPYGILAAELLASFLLPSLYNHTVFVLSVAACLWISIVRMIGNRLLHTNAWYGLLHPVGAVVMIQILGSCLSRIYFKKPSVWRGDYYR